MPNEIWLKIDSFINFLNREDTVANVLVLFILFIQGL